MFKKWNKLLDFLLRICIWDTQIPSKEQHGTKYGIPILHKQKSTLFLRKATRLYTDRARDCVN